MMVKETRFFRKQAEKAERMAVAASDSEASQSFLSLAQAYRSQADALKKSKKEQPKRKRPKATSRKRNRRKGWGKTNRRINPGANNHASFSKLAGSLPSSSADHGRRRHYRIQPSRTRPCRRV
jgi:hypothetical protein